jgi:hypothetical protein
VHAGRSALEELIVRKVTTTILHRNNDFADVVLDADPHQVRLIEPYDTAVEAQLLVLGADEADDLEAAPIGAPTQLPERLDTLAPAIDEYALPHRAQVEEPSAEHAQQSGHDNRHRGGQQGDAAANREIGHEVVETGDDRDAPRMRGQHTHAETELACPLPRGVKTQRGVAQESDQREEDAA